MSTIIELVILLLIYFYFVRPALQKRLASKETAPEPEHVSEPERVAEPVHVTKTVRVIKPEHAAEPEHAAPPISTIKNNEAAQRKCEKEINELKSEFRNAQNTYGMLADSVAGEILQFFSRSTESFDDIIKSLNSIIDGMNKAECSMVASSDKLVEEYSVEDCQLNTVSPTYSVKEALGFREAIKAFREKTNANRAPLSRIMFTEKMYGKANEEFVSAVNSMTYEKAVAFVDKYSKLLREKDFGVFGFASLNKQNSLDEINEILNIDLETVYKCIWFFAMETPFSKTCYENAKLLFRHIYRDSSCQDIVLSDLYYKNKLGGEDSIREAVQELLKDNKYLGCDTHVLASGFMWMNAHSSEKQVLQHMLDNSIEMSKTEQQRLQLLTQGTTVPNNSPPPAAEYIDVSSLAWNENDYNKFFGALSLHNQTLTNYLAIRDEDKSINLPDGIEPPDANNMLKRFKPLFNKEYGNIVECKEANCIAISGSYEENVDGILAFAKECPRMAILLHVEKIGRKLILKFYTLLSPAENDSQIQKDNALSLYKKIGMKDSAWESGIKETMLLGMQQLLNESVAPTPPSNGDTTIF